MSDSSGVDQVWLVDLLRNSLTMSDATIEKKDLQALLKTVVHDHRARGWQVGASGLKRQAETGHWGHFWFFANWRSGSVDGLGPTAGTVSPYLLRVFNRQRTDRAPNVNFIACHARLTWLDRHLSITSDRAAVAIERDRASERRALSWDEFGPWLAESVDRALPELDALLSDDALLAWLADDTRNPTSSDLRYAALLAYHLRRDEDLAEILNRADLAARAEDERARARGSSLSYRSDRQSAYPQDWSHGRFVEHLRACDRD